MNEADLEELAMAWFGKLGYQTAYGPEIEPGGLTQERAEYQEVILWGRFESAIERLNPDAPSSVLRDAKRLFRRRLGEDPKLVRTNRIFQEMLTEGIRIEHRDGGETRTIAIRLMARDDLELNDWFAVNQVTVHHDRNHRIPDIVVFINGLPISVIELKSFVRDRVTLLDAYKQLETYKKEIPLLFNTNQILVASNGKFSRFGSITSGWDRFMPWRAMDFEFEVETELEFMLNDMFEKEKLVEYIHDFVLFLSKRADDIKIIAGYHQYHAAKAALQRTSEEVVKNGRGRIGVIWHTQGSGKSLTMTFLAGLIARDNGLQNPTVIIITDRKDLDGQLFQTFDSAKEYLRQEPVQIEDKDDLIAQLSGRKFGGVIFSTIQKFMPKEKGLKMELLSDRTNIIIMADEAHRSQYDMLDGYAAHLDDAFPNASFIGFTGTPISFEDRDTRGVFGDDISIYDLKQSIMDGSTVNIYYEKQVRKLFSSKESEAIDEAFEAAVDGEEMATTESAKRRWSRLEAAFGAQKRLEDIVSHMGPHIESRSESFPQGKSMIVCATRRICVRLHDMLKEIHPEWYSERDDEGVMKVIMTGSASDNWQEHIRNSTRRGQLGDRFRDPDNDFRIAIVCDMWLTGFNAPSLATMYIDKPMKGHGLMQALARVNRAFKDKTGGLVVDYFGLSARIAEAVNLYTASKGRGSVVVDIEDAEILLTECHEVVKNMFHTIDHSEFWVSEPLEKEAIRRKMLNRINSLVARDPEASRRRFGQAMARLNKAWNLAKASDTARALRDDIKLYQALYGYINQKAPEEQKDPEILDSAIQQILDDTIQPEGLADILNIGNEKSIFDDAFLSRVKEIEEKNLAQAALEQLLRGQILILKGKNHVQQRKFSEMLESTLKRYRDGDLEDIQNVIDDLLDLGREMKAANDRGDDLGLTYEELAFYDALEENEVAVRQMGEGQLCEIAKAMTEKVKELWTVDWAYSERKQAQFRIELRDLLEKFGYPPEECERAVETVLEQAKLNARNHDSGSATA
jgi:type I restriction enzyme, R subunit